MIVDEFERLGASERFFCECFLADVNLFSLSEVWNSLEPGMSLDLTLDTKFSSNPMSVAVVFGKKGSRKIIGHLPKSEKTEEIANILDLGWDDAGEFFLCIVKHKDFKDSDYQLQLLIRLKRCNNPGGL